MDHMLMSARLHAWLATTYGETFHRIYAWVRIREREYHAYHKHYSS
jgi:hypothetical protein